MQKEKSKNMLMDVIGFDEIDLDANARGLLTNSQVNWLRQQRDTNGLWTLLLIVIFGIVLNFMVTPALESIGWPIAMMGGIPGFYLLTITFNKWYTTYQDLSKNRAEMIEGYATRTTRRQNKSRVHYTLKIGGIDFPLEKKIFMLFEHEEAYRIYYAPKSKHILSAERLRG